MITIKEKILINSNDNIIWTFLTDFKKSLSFNQFHSHIIIPPKYSVNEGFIFEIEHNFGFGKYNMKAQVLEALAPRKIIISEQTEDDLNSGFNHEIEFNIIKKDNQSFLEYSVQGTFNNKLINRPFKPILRAVIISELKQIKKAIESIEIDKKFISSKQFKII